MFASVSYVPVTVYYTVDKTGEVQKKAEAAMKAGKIRDFVLRNGYLSYIKGSHVFTTYRTGETSVAVVQLIVSKRLLFHALKPFAF